MKKIDIKQVKYSYGKFYIKGMKEEKHDKLLIKQVSGTSLTPAVGNYYIFSADVNSLLITLPKVNSNYLEEFKIQLNTGDSPNIEFNNTSLGEEYAYTKESIETQDITANTLYEIYGMYVSQKWLITIKEI